MLGSSKSVKLSKLKTIQDLLPLLTSDVASNRSLAVAGIAVSLGMMQGSLKRKGFSIFERSARIKISDSLLVKRLVSDISEFIGNEGNIKRQDPAQMKIKYLYWRSKDSDSNTKVQKASLAKINKELESDLNNSLPDPRYSHVWLANDWKNLHMIKHIFSKLMNEHNLSNNLLLDFQRELSSKIDSASSIKSPLSIQNNKKDGMIRFNSSVKDKDEEKISRKDTYLMKCSKFKPDHSPNSNIGEKRARSVFRIIRGGDSADIRACKGIDFSSIPKRHIRDQKHKLILTRTISRDTRLMISSDGSTHPPRYRSVALDSLFGRANCYSPGFTGVIEPRFGMFEMRKLI